MHSLPGSDTATTTGDEAVATVEFYLSDQQNAIDDFLHHPTPMWVGHVSRTMRVARHRTGVVGTVRALASQVHPVFMLPPVAASLAGAVLAGQLSLPIAGWHASAIFCAVYTAHVTDGYVDFHVRGEDDDHPLTPAGCRVGQAAATAGFLVSLVALWWLAGAAAAALTLPTWVIGSLHAPVLDVRPVTATAGYPAGVALALVGGAFAQTGTVPATVAGLAAVLFVLLCGVKVVDDTADLAGDRSLGKRTVAVVVGRRRARQLGRGLQAVALAATAALAAVGTFPDGALLAVFAGGAVGWRAAGAPPARATMLLTRGTYVFLALLLAALWYRPLAGPPAVDVGVLGPYTYLATEVAFGTLAVALCARADALRRAARTVVALYPLAYLWDRYTLAVGVFEVQLRTGVDLLGIPVEEHVFMVVVPALVVGVHESVNGRGTAG
ncbi:MAG: lycopene cyclase domain-containing protein [Halobacteriaceae archaeon]